MQTEWSPGRNDEHGSRPDADATGDPGAGTDLDHDHGGVTGADAARQAGGVGEEEAQLSAVDAVDGLLDEVELALARLDDGTYGRCATCGSLIADAELAEDPLVRECRSCGAGVLATEGA
jgi:RNA polymerase-binding transcription factor DksA